MHLTSRCGRSGWKSTLLARAVQGCSSNFFTAKLVWSERERERVCVCYSFLPIAGPSLTMFPSFSVCPSERCENASTAYYRMGCVPSLLLVSNTVCPGGPFSPQFIVPTSATWNFLRPRRKKMMTNPGILNPLRHNVTMCTYICLLLWPREMCCVNDDLVSRLVASAASRFWGV